MPKPPQPPSVAFPLRLPYPLYLSLRSEAEKQGTSLNALLVARLGAPAPWGMGLW